MRQMFSKKQIEEMISEAISNYSPHFELLKEDSISSLTIDLGIKLENKLYYLVIVNETQDTEAFVGIINGGSEHTQIGYEEGNSLGVLNLSNGETTTITIYAGFDEGETGTYDIYELK